jgi:hypothetical protein
MNKILKDKFIDLIEERCSQLLAESPNNIYDLNSFFAGYLYSVEDLIFNRKHLDTSRDCLQGMAEVFRLDSQFMSQYQRGRNKLNKEQDDLYSFAGERYEILIKEQQHQKKYVYIPARPRQIDIF